ncbi:type II toxin-antitoxin system prevent-host-death family antitoxin, partial [Craurococcus roseus]|uniref:type II toxin-antitoxin system prevent-host-death family antitoxin n=1 Tax=Craurococcus roseus TaxID=77585 RepID=UPI0031E13F6A
MADAKNRFSELIDRALAGEGVTITRHGRPVVELRPVEAGPGPVRQEDLDWLRARAVGRGPVPARAYSLVASSAPVLLVSDFAAAEIASALAGRVRTAGLTADKAREAFADFDGWTTRAARRVETTAAGMRAAEAFVRRLDLALRAPDALNIAIAQREGAWSGPHQTGHAAWSAGCRAMDSRGGRMREPGRGRTALRPPNRAGGRWRTGMAPGPGSARAWPRSGASTKASRTPPLPGPRTGVERAAGFGAAA